MVSELDDAVITSDKSEWLQEAFDKFEAAFDIVADAFMERTAMYSSEGESGLSDHQLHYLMTNFTEKVASCLKSFGERVSDAA